MPMRQLAKNSLLHFSLIQVTVTKELIHKTLDFAHFDGSRTSQTNLINIKKKRKEEECSNQLYSESYLQNKLIVFINTILNLFHLVEQPHADCGETKSYLLLKFH